MSLFSTHQEGGPGPSGSSRSEHLTRFEAPYVVEVIEESAAVLAAMYPHYAAADQRETQLAQWEAQQRLAQQLTPAMANTAMAGVGQSGAPGPLLGYPEYYQRQGNPLLDEVARIAGAGAVNTSPELN
jgi:hypothetical protein